MRYRSISTKVEIDVHMDDFNDDDIADEIQDRIQRARGKFKVELKKKFAQAMQGGGPNSSILSDLSLLDTMKMELAQKIADRSTLQELEELYRKL